MNKGSNLHCTSPSTSAQPHHHPSTSFYFAVPHSLMAKGTNALSHLRKETKEVFKDCGKILAQGRGGLNDGIYSTHKPAWEF